MADGIKRPSPIGGRSQSTAPSTCIHASPGPEMMARRPPFQAPGSQSLKFKPERNSAPEAGRLSRSALRSYNTVGESGGLDDFPASNTPSVMIAATGVERKRVGEGKVGAERVELGGCCNI